MDIMVVVGGENVEVDVPVMKESMPPFFGLDCDVVALRERYPALEACGSMIGRASLISATNGASSSAGSAGRDDRRS